MLDRLAMLETPPKGLAELVNEAEQLNGPAEISDRKKHMVRRICYSLKIYKE